MKTIWLKLSLEKKGFKPETDFEKQYLNSIKVASASHIQPRNEIEQPDFTAKSFNDILEGVKHCSFIS